MANRMIDAISRMIRRNHRQSIQFVALFIPIFLLIQTITTGLYGDQMHRSTTHSSFNKVSHRFQIQITGCPNVLPTDRELGYFSHTLFSYLNKALTPQQLQISSIDIDKSKTRLSGGNSNTKFTVISESSAKRRKGEMVYQEGIIEENKSSDEDRLLSRQVGSSANKLFIEIIVNGRDYTMLPGRFESSVKLAINIGHKKLIEEVVSPAAAEEYFKGISWIGAVIIRPSARNQNVENGRNNKNPDRSDPTTSFDGSIQLSGRTGRQQPTSGECGKRGASGNTGGELCGCLKP